MTAPGARRRLPGWAVLGFIFLCGGALAGGIYFLLQTQPPGSQATP